MKEVWRFIMFCRMVLVIGVMVSFSLSMKQGQCLTLNTQGLALLEMKERVVRDPLGALMKWKWKWNGEEDVNVAFACDRHIGQQGDHIQYMRKLLQSENSANSHKTKKGDEKNTPSSTPPSSSPFSKHVSPSISPSNSPSPSFLLPSPLSSPEVSPSPVVAPIQHLTLISDPPTYASTPPQSNWISAPSPATSSNQDNSNTSKNQKQHSVIVWSSVGGFSLLVLVSFTVFICFRSSKVVTVKPWATGLSGQLRKAFVTGIPSLKRAELVVACEDFSNIIGSLQDETIYKGTLSSGVEIAVVSSAVTSSQDWSKNMQTQFRKKIEMLSRMNHKNFVNLIGYCEENKPFTRMMVFEYAPNGTFYEHLHIRETEKLDWAMRKRIAMGISYCLEYMHQLTPPIAHRNLLSSSIYLTEDYAAKVSDLSFWSDIVDIKKGSDINYVTPETKDNVYSFGVILFELITGKIPFAVDNGFLTDWAAEYIRGQPLRDLLDSSLMNCLKEDEVEKWSEVINDCVNPDHEKRPSMKEVTKKLKEITSMEPDGATPKSSPLWWAEIEIMSSDL